MITPQQLGSVYSAYSNTMTPARALHEKVSVGVCLKAAKAQSALADHSPSTADFMQHQARAWGARAGAVGAGAFKLVDVVVGTGLHEAGKVAVSNSGSLAKHVGELASALPDTGLAGIVTGCIVGLPLALGAVLGAGITLVGVGVMSLLRGLVGYGTTITDVKGKLSTGAATGALAFAGITCVATPTVPLAAGIWAIAVGTARTFTGIAKMATVGALYGLGYTVGYAVAAMQTEPKVAQPAA